MMGRQRREQGKLFYEFRLEDRIPENRAHGLMTPAKRRFASQRERLTIRTVGADSVHALQATHPSSRCS